MAFALKIIQLFLLCTILSLYAAALAAEGDEQTRRRLATEEQLSKLQLQIKQLQTSQAQNRTSLSKEQQALKQTDVLIGKSRKSLETIRKKQGQSQSRLTALKAQRKRLEQEKSAQQKSLKKQIRAAYAGGKQEYLKVLFNQEDPTKVGRTLVYYDYLNKARVEKIQALNTILEKLVQVEIEINSEQQQLKILETKLAQENSRLASLK